MIFRWYYHEAGGYTHVRCFAGTSSTSLGKCGDLVFRNKEWAVLKPILAKTPVEPIEEQRNGTS